MNLLEHYVTNITHEEPIEKNGMLFFKVVCDVDCYGNKEIQKEVLLSEDDYAERSLDKKDVTLDMAMVEIRDTVDAYDEYFQTGRKPQ